MYPALLKGATPSGWRKRRNYSNERVNPNSAFVVVSVFGLTLGQPLTRGQYCHGSGLTLLPRTKTHTILCPVLCIGATKGETTATNGHGQYCHGSGFTRILKLPQRRNRHREQRPTQYIFPVLFIGGTRPGWSKRRNCSNKRIGSIQPRQRVHPNTETATKVDSPPQNKNPHSIYFPFYSGKP